jgi:hypothetical protein
MRAAIELTVLVPLLLLAACESDVISLGARRCEGTQCAPAAAVEASVASPLIAERAEGSAQLLWRAPVSCAAPADVPCDSYDVSDDPHAASGDWPAQWFVAADGTVTEARITQTASEHGEDPPRLLLVRKLAADGSTIWEHVDAELLGQLFPPAPRPPALRMAFAPDGEDGAALLALGTFEPERALHVFAFDAAGERTPALRIARGGVPQRIAVSGDRIFVLGSYEDGAELAAYHRDGTLLWRQTQLYDRAAAGDRLRPPVPRPLALAPDGSARVLLRLENTYEEVSVNRDGVAGDWRRMCSAPAHPEGANSALAFDTSGRLVAAMDSSASAYVIARCQEADCKGAPLQTTGGRQQQSYYPPELLGMSVDPAGQIYVATHDGALMERRLIIDRISADFSERRAFVVESEGVENLYPQAIAAGSQGDVYYWADGEIGRIALDP